MEKKVELLNNEVVLVNWDWPDGQGPKVVEARIIIDYGNDWYGISLHDQIILKDGSRHQKLKIEGRHKGHPIIEIVPGFIRKLFVFNSSIYKLLSPLVAVNVSTEGGLFFSTASVYLKSDYLK